MSKIKSTLSITRTISPNGFDKLFQRTRKGMEEPNSRKGQVNNPQSLLLEVNQNEGQWEEATLLDKEGAQLKQKEIAEETETREKNKREEIRRGKQKIGDVGMRNSSQLNS